MSNETTNAFESHFPWSSPEAERTRNRIYGFMKDLASVLREFRVTKDGSVTEEVLNHLKSDFDESELEDITELIGKIRAAEGLFPKKNE